MQQLDVDVQKEKKKFKDWRRRQVILIFVLLFIALVVLPVRLSVKYGEVGFVEVFFVSFGNWEGWAALALGLMACFLYCLLADNRFHFQCPHPDCKMSIDLHDPWVCPYCHNNNISYPSFTDRTGLGVFFFRCTIFDKCAARGHVPESYKCMSSKHHPSGFVFELIPGGKKQLPGYKNEPSVSPQVVQLPSPPPPVQGQVMPRDRNFFG